MPRKNKAIVATVWIIVTVLLAGCVSPSGLEVSRATWTDGEWPLTVEKGRIDCIEVAGTGLKAAIFIDDKYRNWALNGVASSQGFGQKLEPIWKVDKTYPGGMTTRVNIGSMTNRALALCD